MILKRRLIQPMLLALMLGLAVSGCGSDYTVFHPAGPVAQSELNLIVLSTVVVGIIILLIWALWAYVLIRFRDKPGNKAPYWPTWRHHRLLEVLVFIFPVVALVIIAIPTIRKTYALAHIPAAKRPPLVIDVTSLDYKWLFEYPQQHVATVNYFYMPVGRPVLFELTAHSPFGAFWVPNLGGMEYTMPNRVLPLWLEATRTGVFDGRNANFSGKDFWRMSFKAHAVPESQFQSWAQGLRQHAPRLTDADWQKLQQFTVVRASSYSSYPSNTFPERPTEFTVHGLYYTPTHKP